jgi:hypothetical protein
VPTVLYGLSLGAERPDAVSGLGGAPVRELPARSLRALVGTVDAKPAPSLQSVREHDAVLRAYVRAGATVAAVRFGQVFDDDAACVEEVVERSSRIETLLAEHLGCVEMRVLLPVRDADVPATHASAGPGRSYLESLRDRGHVSPRLSLSATLGPAVRAERVEGFASRQGDARGVAFAHLVHRDDLEAYRQAVRMSPALTGARVVGPLPLYSFAEPS